MNPRKILIVAAHPDDEILGCGGTIAKYSPSNDVYIAILGEGASARYPRREDVPKECFDELQKQSRQVGKTLGVKDNLFLNLPDNRFDTVPFLDIVKKVENIISEIGPDIIYTHHGGDLNIDHRISFLSVLTAARPAKGCPVKEVYSFEVPSSTEWSFQRVNGPFCPNVFEDISQSMDLKIKCMNLYKNETGSFPHPRSEEALISIAKRWGAVAGVGCAEAFELIRWLK